MGRNEAQQELGSSASLTLIQRQSEMIELYHEAYAAHHGERGPVGCPCCAEFRSRIEAATAALLHAINDWKRDA